VDDMDANELNVYTQWSSRTGIWAPLGIVKWGSLSVNVIFVKETVLKLRSDGLCANFRYKSVKNFSHID